MRHNKGITLIALVITIIVLLILAGVAISSLTAQNGVLNRAQDSKLLNINGAFTDQLRLAQMSTKTSITANKTSKAGYIATTSGNLAELAQNVAKGLGVTAVQGSNGTEIATEGYTVAYYLDTAGNDSTNGDGYIVIWYTDNALRSSIKNRDEVIANLGLTDVAVQNNSRNQATLVGAIKVENYKCELAGQTGLTSTTDGDSDIGKGKFSGTTLNDFFTLQSAEEPVQCDYFEVEGRHAFFKGVCVYCGYVCQHDRRR